MRLFISAHNDDESLFGAIMIQRYGLHVLIVTDSYKQPWTNAKERRLETKKAMAILNATHSFLGIKDNELNEKELRRRLEPYKGLSCFAPLPEKDGNIDHNLIGKVCGEVFKNITYYVTYTKTRLSPIGNVKITPTETEHKKKREALKCYVSQLEKNKPHFDAVEDGYEYLK